MQRYAAEPTLLLLRRTPVREAVMSQMLPLRSRARCRVLPERDASAVDEHYKMYDYIRNELPNLVMHLFRQRPESQSQVILWAGWARGAGVT